MEGAARPHVLSSTGYARLRKEVHWHADVTRQPLEEQARIANRSAGEVRISAALVARSATSFLVYIAIIMD